MTEKERLLIKRIKKGDPKALEDFKKEYTPIIFRIVEKHRLGHLVSDHHALAEKVLKDVLGYIKRHEIRKGLVEFLYKPTVYKIYNLAKKNPVPLGEKEETIHDPRPDPLEILMIIEKEEKQEKTVKCLKECFESLTNTQKVVMDLRTKGYSWADIARMKGVSQPYIHQVKTAAIKGLMECIKEKDEEISEWIAENLMS